MSQKGFKIPIDISKAGDGCGQWGENARQREIWLTAEKRETEKRGGQTEGEGLLKPQKSGEVKGGNKAAGGTQKGKGISSQGSYDQIAT